MGTDRLVARIVGEQACETFEFTASRGDDHHALPETEILMQKILFALSLGFAGLILATHASQAQTASCGQRTQVVERLASKYGEVRQSIGLAQNNGVLEVFASPDSGTWTIVITRPSGMTCLVAAGEAFEAVEDTPTATGEKA